ncbi:hypothetical protein JHK82_021396 [Glycine max]|nr:hypothetical protein JHK82_021396 [Glycine max]
MQHARIKEENVLQIAFSLHIFLQMILNDLLVFTESMVAGMLKECFNKFHHTYVNNLQILYFEAHCRIQGPIYGCAGIIFKLYEQINSTEIALAYIDIQTQTACHKLQAESNFD